MYTPNQRLMRSRSDTIIAGVASGIGRYFAVDPVLVRLALIAFCFSGVGIFIYPILWLVMPLEPAANAGDMREVFVAHGSAVQRPRYDPMSGLPNEPEEIPIENINPSATTPETSERRNQWLGYALLIVGVFFLLSMVAGLSGLIAKLLFPAILIGAGIYLLRRNG